MLPKAVREAAEKADALQQQMNGNTDPAPVQSEPQAAPVAEAPPQEAAPQVQQPAQSTDWEHKYRVLSNKYSAEVPRLAQEIRELKDKLRAAEAKQTAVADVKLPDGLTPEKVKEQYGEDFSDAVSTVAARMAEERINKFREEFAPKVDTAVNNAAVTSRQAFMQQLEVAVPDWMTIDQEEAFTAFLDEVDDLTGRPRREFFSEADRNYDAGRVIRFFKSYREKSAPKTDPLRQQVASNTVEYSLSPSSVRTTEVPLGKKVWSQPEIRKFYNDARRGLVGPEEFRRIESDIFAAQTEGRLLAA